MGKLEFDFNSHLSFAPRKHLQHLGKLGSGGVRTLLGNSIDCRGISSVEQIEKLQVHVQPGSFPKIKPFSESHIRIHEPWRHKVIASFCKVDAIKMVVAINVRSSRRKCGTIMKPALRTKNTTKAGLPGKLEESMRKERVIQRQIRRPLIQSRAIVK